MTIFNWPVTAEIVRINIQSGDTWHDLIAITNAAGDQICEILVESSEDEADYEKAVRNAGYSNFVWATQSL